MIKKKEEEEEKRKKNDDVTLQYSMADKKMLKIGGSTKLGLYVKKMSKIPLFFGPG